MFGLAEVVGAVVGEGVDAFAVVEGLGTSGAVVGGSAGVARAVRGCECAAPGVVGERLGDAAAGG